MNFVPLHFGYSASFELLDQNLRLFKREYRDFIKKELFSPLSKLSKKNNLRTKEKLLPSLKKIFKEFDEKFSENFLKDDPYHGFYYRIESSYYRSNEFWTHAGNIKSVFSSLIQKLSRYEKDMKTEFSRDDVNTSFTLVFYWENRSREIDLVKCAIKINVLDLF